MRLLLDTHVLVSALIGQGPPHRLMLAARINLAHICTNADIVSESERILHSKKLAFRLGYLNLQADEIMHQFRHIATICADATRVDAVVSCDKDMLSMKRYNSIPVLRPRQALQRIVFKSGFP